MRRRQAELDEELRLHNEELAMDKAMDESAWAAYEQRMRLADFEDRHGLLPDERRTMSETEVAVKCKVDGCDNDAKWLRGLYAGLCDVHAAEKRHSRQENGGESPAPRHHTALDELMMRKKDEPAAVVVDDSDTLEEELLTRARAVAEAKAQRDAAQAMLDERTRQLVDFAMEYGG